MGVNFVETVIIIYLGIVCTLEAIKQINCIVSDKNKNLYITNDSNHNIYRMNSIGNISIYAGSSISGYNNGELKEAQFYEPYCIIIDNNDVLYLSDHGNHRIRQIKNNTVNTTCGSGPPSSKVYNLS